MIGAFLGPARRRRTRSCSASLLGLAARPRLARARARRSTPRSASARRSRPARSWSRCSAPSPDPLALQLRAPARPKRGPGGLPCPFADLLALAAQRCGAVVALASLGCNLISADRSDGPNVLLVTIDTLRADRVGAYGARDVATPTLDALAARGRAVRAGDGRGAAHAAFARLDPDRAVPADARRAAQRHLPARAPRRDARRALPRCGLRDRRRGGRRRARPRLRPRPGLRVLRRGDAEERASAAGFHERPRRT